MDRVMALARVEQGRTNDASDSSDGGELSLSDEFQAMLQRVNVGGYALV